MYRDANQAETLKAAGQCDYSFLLFHGEKDQKNKPDGRIIATNDGNVTTSDITAEAKKAGKVCTIFGCYIYPNKDRDSGQNVTIRLMTAAIADLKKCDCLPVKKVCVVLGIDEAGDNRSTGGEKIQAPEYPKTWMPE